MGWAEGWHRGNKEGGYSEGVIRTLHAKLSLVGPFPTPYKCLLPKVLHPVLPPVLQTLPSPGPRCSVGWPAAALFLDTLHTHVSTPDQQLTAPCKSSILPSCRKSIQSTVLRVEFAINLALIYFGHALALFLQTVARRSLH